MKLEKETIYGTVVKLESAHYQHYSGLPNRRGVRIKRRAKTSLWAIVRFDHGSEVRAWVTSRGGTGARRATQKSVLEKEFAHLLNQRVRMTFNPFSNALYFVEGLEPEMSAKT